MSPRLPSLGMSYLPFTVLCEKVRATGWGWDVFNALINVTSPLMWNRHFESVAHAVKKGWCADGETASSGDLQIKGPTSVSTLLCPVKRLRLWNLKFKGPSIDKELVFKLIALTTCLYIPDCLDQTSDFTV